MIVIVPDCLSEQINAALDKAYTDCPEAAEEREQHYTQLLSFFNENGFIPDFSFAKATGQRQEAGA